MFGYSRSIDAVFIAIVHLEMASKRTSTRSKRPLSDLNELQPCAGHNDTEEALTTYGLRDTNKISAKQSNKRASASSVETGAGVALRGRQRTVNTIAPTPTPAPTPASETELASHQFGRHLGLGCGRCRTNPYGCSAGCRRKVSKEDIKRLWDLRKKEKPHIKYPGCPSCRYLRRGCEKCRKGSGACEAQKPDERNVEEEEEEETLGSEVQEKTRGGPKATRGGKRSRGRDDVDVGKQNMAVNDDKDGDQCGTGVQQLQEDADVDIDGSTSTDDEKNMDAGLVEKGERGEKMELDATAKASPPSLCASMALPEENEEKEAKEEEEKEWWWNPRDQTKISHVLDALHVSSGSTHHQIPLCREKQVEVVDAWLKTRVLKEKKGGSLYISGLPGTGKSLTATGLVRQCTTGTETDTTVDAPPVLMSINCMRLSDPRQVMERILAGYLIACRQVSQEEELLVTVTGNEKMDGIYTRRESSVSSGAAGVKEVVEQLKKIVYMPPSSITASSQGGNSTVTRRSTTSGPSSSKKATSGGVGNGNGDGRGMVVVVLDELDGLLTGRHGDSLVGDLFALAHAPKSRLLLIGIANSIDLVQQLMRPGGALYRHNIRPEHVIFPAYNNLEIAQVLEQRVRRLPGPVFDPKALMFCAKKISNGSGDMRRALEACAKAVTIHCNEQQKEVGSYEGEGTAVATPPVLVSMRHMAVALSKVTGGIGMNNDNVAAIRKLPVPQQLMMVAVSKLLGEKSNARGWAVAVPSARGTVSAAARFIGTAPIEQSLLTVHGNDPFTTSAAAQQQKKKKSSLMAGGRQRRLSSAFAAPGDGQNKGLTVGDLKAAHTKLCKRVGVAPYGPSEFGMAMDMLCTMGLVAVGGAGGRGGGFGTIAGQGGLRQRVSLSIAEDDVLMALADVPVLKHVVGA